MERSTVIFLVGFFAIVLTGVALIAPGAHLFEHLSKMALVKAEYQVVQKIYQGWWIAGLLLPAALLANVILAFLTRSVPSAFALALCAGALIVINLVIFVIWTQPVNAVTRNWALAPNNWEELRAQWEYSHVVNAAVTFIAFCLSIGGTLIAVAKN